MTLPVCLYAVSTLRELPNGDQRHEVSQIVASSYLEALGAIVQEWLETNKDMRGKIVSITYDPIDCDQLAWILAQAEDDKEQS